MGAKRRATSSLVETSAPCRPLREMYAAAEALQPKTWDVVEAAFLEAMSGFDRNVASGVATQGDRQNGKGDFFNDLLALILESCSGVTLWSRSGVPGLIFPRHSIDIAYPPKGIVEFMVEAKAVGTPRHPGNKRQKNPLGRPGAADLDKRMKEVGFKSIDLKAEYGRLSTASGTTGVTGPSGDLTSWLRRVKPDTYLFIAARVVDASDLRRVVEFAQRATLFVDSVGLYCYKPESDDSPTSYVRAPIKESTLDISRVLYRACSALRGLAAGDS